MSTSQGRVRLLWSARAAVRRGLAGVVWLLAAACSGPEPPDLLLRNAWIVDATSLQPRGPVDIAVRDGWIESVRPSVRLSGRPSGEGRGAVEDPGTLEVSGRFVVPGFVDLHVHLPSDSTVQDAVLRQLVEYGVTTILNPGARAGSGPELRDRIDDDLPRMRTAGLIIESRPDGEDISHWATRVSSADEARAEVRRQVASGVDFIKFYSGVSPDVARAIVSEATAAGVPVIAHAGATSWLQAVDAGVSMLVHSGYGTPMDEIVNLADPGAAADPEWYAGYADAPNGAAFGHLVDRLVAGGVTVVPTLAITQAAGLGEDATLLSRFETHLAPDARLPGWWPEGWEIRHPQYGDDVGPEEAELLRRVYWPGVLGIVRAYHERGVRLGVGTDVGNAWITPGASFHYEMGLYAEAGIPPHEILTMATLGGATALGLADSLGTVEVGKRADLVVLGADPTVDIAATREIEFVIRSGRVVARPAG